MAKMTTAFAAVILGSLTVLSGAEPSNQQRSTNLAVAVNEPAERLKRETPAPHTWGPVPLAAGISAKMGYKSAQITNLMPPTAPTFIENRGQFDQQVKFQVRGSGATLWLTGREIVFDLQRTNAIGGATHPENSTTPAHIRDRRPRIPGTASIERLVFAEEFVDANGDGVVEAEDEQPGIYNYFKGSDPHRWYTRVHSYSEVVYRNLWSGIDIRLHRIGVNVEQEFVVRPGADPSRVQMAYRGVEGLRVADDGSLIVRTPFGEFRESKPYIYQEVGGKQVPLDGRFKLLANCGYTFEIAAYLPQYALVIDPTLLYSTFLGGTSGSYFGTGHEFATGIAVDSTGSAYVTGETGGPLAVQDFPTTVGSFQSTNINAGFSSCFITKLNPLGNALVYSTYLSGTTDSVCSGIAVNSAGEAYVVGTASLGDPSPGFPITPNAYQSTLYHEVPFLAKLSAPGDTLLYSTTLGAPGGGGNAAAIAVDSSGRAYITGGVQIGWPTTAGAFQGSSGGGGSDAFVSVFDPSLSGAASLVYSTYLGGSNFDFGTAIAVDAVGNVYVTGETDGPKFPVTTGAFQTTYKGGREAFVAKLNPKVSGSGALIYSTYLGAKGDGIDPDAAANAIAVDPSGNAYLTGSTSSTNFPLTNGAFLSQIICTTLCDYVFVSKLNAAGSELVYSTALGDTGANAGGGGSGIAVDSSGNAYITGSTRGASFPVTADAFQGTVSGSSGFNAFVTKLNATGSSLIYSSFLGGSNGAAAAAIALDPTGDAYVTGSTSSLDFPVTPFAFQPTLHGNPPCNGCVPEDVFVTKFPLGTVGGLSITGSLPNSGGNTGTVTPQIVGSGFHTGASVKLGCSGPSSIVGTNPGVGTTGRFLNTTFDLTGAPPGTCDIVLTNPDGTSATLSKAFTIQQGGAPNVWVDLVGRDQIPFIEDQGLGTSDFYIVVGNNGNNDAAIVPVWFSVPSAVALAPDFLLTSPPLPAGVAPLGPDEHQFEVSVSGTTVGGLIVPFVPAGATFAIPFRMAITSALAPFNIVVWTSTRWVADFSSLIVQGDPSAVKCLGEATVLGLAALLPAGSGALVAAETAITLSSATNLGIAIYDKAGKEIVFGVPDLIFSETAFLQDAGIIAPLARGTAFKLAGTIFSDILLLRDCASVIAKISQRQLHVNVVTSADPNDKAGSHGVGSQQYISGKTPLRYAIYFSNEVSATAPAQKVSVTDQLDPINEDFNSFGLGPLIFGSQVLSPARGLTDYSATVDLRPEVSLLVVINSHLDQSTGLLTWTFQSLDPSTMQPPTDPEVGFLPPGGNGSVFFTVNPKQGLQTNTQIQNQATIVFDVNAPISTPTWLNTLDDTPPTSQVTALAATETTASFPVQWSGNDVGSGLASFTTYVSDNGGPFTAFQTNTTAKSVTFTGQAGHTYGFYSIATDAVGNVEPAKTVAEATTTMASAVALSAGQISTTASGLVYSRVSKSFAGTVTVKNINASPLNGPFQIVFTSLPTGITLANATGTFNGSPFMTVPNMASLAVGQSATVNVQFLASPTSKVTFTPVVYSGSF